MIVARSLEELAFDKNSVVTVGTFDGLHLGHRAIVDQLVAGARSIRGRSVVITFNPHPREIVAKRSVEWLTTLDDRCRTLEQFGIDVLFVVTFTYEFSRLSSRDFYEKFVVRGTGAREVIVGYDHMFGRDREAGIHELRQMGEEFGFRVSVVDPVSLGGAIVSSSKIRDRLREGNVAQACEYLGRPYSLEGTVIEGDHRGTRLGFPTANIAPEHEHQLVPAEGVYAVLAYHSGKRYRGMMNIGRRPTVSESGERFLEVHLFAFEGTLYGDRLRVEFINRIRSEEKFASLEELKRQLERDRNECLRILADRGY
ncbi:MAG TPA: bifunctional riboflavin kinase/FAD synthetase [Bacteroidota bacterium]|nr:bifunctional riboflavin kinase/FAD synthetase [Bacteroidota bacterium]